MNVNEREALRQCRADLDEAATSLETLANGAGTDEYLDDFTNVRGYARSRASVARSAIAAADAVLAQPDACANALSRFHHLMHKHGLHPGRTDDDLLDILDRRLGALAQPRECNDNDSPWLVCKRCAEVGKCERAQPAPEPAGERMGLDAIRQAIEERDDMERQYHDLAEHMVYKGNSVSWWHSKATAYRDAIDKVWDALRLAGISAGDNKTCADGVRELANHQPTVTLPPLPYNLGAFDSIRREVEEWHDQIVASLKAEGVGVKT